MGATQFTFAVADYSVTNSYFASSLSPQDPYCQVKLALAADHLPDTVTSGVITVDFLEASRLIKEGSPVGGLLTDNGQVDGSITLSLDDFDRFMAVLRHGHPAVLKAAAQQSAVGSIEYNIGELSFSGGWGVTLS